MSSESYQMLAKTFDGLEEVLKIELEDIGASNVEVVNRGVKFSGTKETLYRANFCCRTALRILRIIGEFSVKGANDLYRNVNKMEWENYMDVTQTFAINSTVNSEAFNNSMFVSLKTKDAIVDRLRAKFDKRPSVNTDDPDIRINVHASADAVTISLDSSGESLHKRGYRVGQNEASMSEVLAAGILKIADWKGQTDFYDTMCGSGTIAIEAALIARNIPPGMFRQEFAFERWKDFDEDLLEKVYNEDYEVPFEHNIYASDISSLSVKVAEKNAKSAGVLKSIEFKEQDFAQFEPQSKGGLLIINPPYGERMNDRKVEPLYNMIGNQLKHQFQGFKAWVFSSSEEGFKNIGLKPSKKIPLYNGPLECSLRLFEVYEGSKKAGKQDNGGGRRSKPMERPGRDFQSTNRPKRDFRPSDGQGKDFRKDKNREEFGGKRREDFKGERGKDNFNRERRKEDSVNLRNKSDFEVNSRRDKFHADRRLRGGTGRVDNENSSKEDNSVRKESANPNRGKRPRIK